MEVERGGVSKFGLVVLWWNAADGEIKDDLESVSIRRACQ